eukprot:TRINITY_DN16779_c0_g1_i1.p2 TRINITY_DN16779_c0_g1~~TRINITY_DN16779_c0_g1_i1.p2  ORF type:complete len:109 (-),score=23.89 TRINITY_DN16779_c0_g1_i1:249-575(-)
MATPRINGTMLPNYVGARVRFVGSVTSTNPPMWTVNASDNVAVSVRSNTGADAPSTYIEVIGTVSNNGGQFVIESESVTAFGDNFDLNNYNDLVNLSQKVPDLFVPSA